MQALSELFTDLINLSFIKGIFPNILTGHVLLTFKKRDKTDKNSYRLISLIPNVSKILEKLIYKRLYIFLEKNNNLCLYQFEFRPKHSTNCAHIEITEQIQKPCDKGLFVCGVYLDLKNSF